jgi:hypothetical protein
LCGAGSPLYTHLPSGFWHKELLNFYIKGLGPAFKFMKKEESDVWQKLLVVDYQTFLEEKIHDLKNNKEKLYGMMLHLIFYRIRNEDAYIKRVLQLLEANETQEILNVAIPENDMLFNNYYIVLEYLYLKHGENSTLGDRIKTILLDPDGVEQYRDGRFRYWLRSLISVSFDNREAEARDRLMEIIENKELFKERRTLIEDYFREVFSSDMRIPDFLEDYIRKQRLQQHD